MRTLQASIRRLYRGQGGFTLIELLVVIGILAVLAGVVTLGVTKFIGKGADEAWSTEKHNVQTAIAAYMAENNGAVPTSGITAGEVHGQLGIYLLTTTRWSFSWDDAGIIIEEVRAESEVG